MAGEDYFNKLSSSYCLVIVNMRKYRCRNDGILLACKWFDIVSGGLCMSISVKMMSGDTISGPKIYISFPVGFSNLDALNITEELNKYLSMKIKNTPAMWGAASHHSEFDVYQSYLMENDTPPKDTEDFSISKTTTLAESAKSNTQLQPDADCTPINKKHPAAHEDWPTQGYVTINEIINYWTIDRSSFLDRVRKGIFSKAMILENRPHNAPKVWDASIIGKELSANGYVRRAHY